ncbi:seleno U [Chlorella sorokiniana]|uniref:Seleno U n=1 Tax=Chlorella sorokiniana TaxID=3076 RepID=A0A2P6TRZ6_CHLSO|nr:seleno U [Chlorella sorokiniana]|eukprot:PRW56839.1 seleno U [Chlorella sorokiniana]
MLSARLGAVACAPGRAGPVLRLGPSPRLSAALDGFAGITVTHPINRGRASLVPAAVGGSGSGAAPAGNATPGLADAFDRLRGITVHRVSDKQEVEITSLWGADERAVLAFGRHMG